MRATIPLIYCTFIALLHCAYGCVFAGRTYTQIELYYLSKTTVLGVFGNKVENYNGQFYTWTFNLEVKCVLKNEDSRSVPNNIQVIIQSPKIPSTDSCVDYVKAVYPGLEAIVMLEFVPTGSYYTFWRKSLSNPVRSYSAGSISAILQVCGYQQPQPPNQGTFTCPSQTTSAAECITGSGAADQVKRPCIFTLMVLCVLAVLLHC